MSFVDLALRYNPVKSLKVPVKLGASALLSLALILFLMWDVTRLLNKDIREIEKGYLESAQRYASNAVSIVSKPLIIIARYSLIHISQ